MKKPTAIDILNRRAAEKVKAVSVPVQLELWSEKVRGLPNTLARCALFTAAGKKEDRTKFSDHIVFSTKGYTLTYSGEELRQDDQDVFLQLVHMTRGVPVGHKLDVTGYEILKGLGWGKGGRDYDRLSESVLRLARSRIEIVGEALHFVGGLLPSMTRVGDAASSRFSLWLDPEVIKLFGDNMYSLVDWSDRLKLSALAKWLHSFYFTHKEPIGYRVETLHKLCGSKSKNLRMFKFKLQKALQELVDCGFLAAFELLGELVTVRRKRAAPLLEGN
jgi:hypothetical protein